MRDEPKEGYKLRRAPGVCCHEPSCDYEGFQYDYCKSCSKVCKGCVHNKKMKCNLKGCGNKAELIEKPGMSSATLCQQHFEEIYTGIIYKEGPDTDELVKSKYYRRATPTERAQNKS